MKKLLFFLSLLLFCGVFVYADVPKKINVQGKLTSDSGQVLAEKTISSAVLHLRPIGASGESYPVDTKTGTTDSNGLYSLNFDVVNFNFSTGAEFKIVLTVDSQVISTSWSNIATNPYSFYSSTATYSILSANAITASSMTVTGAGSDLFWGYDVGGTNQLWRTVIVSTSNVTGLSGATVATAGTLGTTGSAANLFWGYDGTGTNQLWRAVTVSTVNVTDLASATVANAINSTNATIATTAIRASSMTALASGASNLFWGYDSGGTVQDWRIVPVSSSSVTGLASASVANATNAGNATYATTAVRASSMTALASGASNLFWGYDSGGTVQNWRSLTISSSNVTGLSTADVGTAATISTSGGSGNYTKIWTIRKAGVNVTQTWEDIGTSLTAGNGIDITSGVVTVKNGAGLSFSGTSLIVTTAPYATGAGTATTVVDGAITAAKIGVGEVIGTKIAADAISDTKISTGAVTETKIGTGAVTEAKIGTGAVTETKIGTGAITSGHFKYEGSYGNIYNIKVSSAEYADVAYYAETGGADLAEIYASTELLIPGDVVSIDTSKDNSIVKTKVAEDTLVAGVISTKPGLLMNKSEKGYELAMVGKVPTKVCNEGGSIKRGDLLVSASIAGYAKKASDNPKTGTVIGKALENFDSITGTILVLVNLQ